jgi:hypothetical protein
MAAEPLDDEQVLTQFHADIEDFLEERAQALDHGMSPAYVRMLFNDITPQEYGRVMMSRAATAHFEAGLAATAERRRLEAAYEEAKWAVQRAEDQMARTDARHTRAWLGPGLQVVGLIAPLGAIGAVLLVQAIAASRSLDRWPLCLLLISAAMLSWLFLTVGAHPARRARALAFVAGVFFASGATSLVMQPASHTAVANSDLVRQQPEHRDAPTAERLGTPSSKGGSVHSP